MTKPTDGWILWAGTVGFEGPLIERLDAAVASGYRRVSLSPLDVRRSSMSPGDIGRAAADRGLRWILDPVVAWLPASSTWRELGPFGADEALAMAADLDVVSASAIALTSRPQEVGAIADAFAAFCDRAADAGIDVHLEFVPMTVVADLATAWEIVRTADRPNGGLVFDTWHFFRGTPDLDLLAEVPGDRIFAVQVDDAPAEPAAPLWEDTFHRLLPGDGDFDLSTVMRVLERTGGLRWIGPEVFSAELAA
ncbi:MAG TPA: sugar phosphate isomerase/epimerase, partial [Acidimicrobiia bacterium]|nr:sugar phosphate isomerase/epimerase [Acidimicrobiia bacterium]